MSGADLRGRGQVGDLRFPECAFIHATNSLRLFAGRFFARHQELRIDGYEPDRLEIILQIIRQGIDDVADMGIFLA